MTLPDPGNVFKSDNILFAEALCTNTPGTRTCECNPGWTGNGIGDSGCVDINECETDNGGCMADHQCINTPGSRECQCNTGYEGTGVGPTGCTDIDECLTDNGGCHAGLVCGRGPKGDDAL